MENENSLKQRLAELDAQFVEINRELRDLHTRRKALVAAKKATEQALISLRANTGDLRVSDHAVVRYLERVEGVDVQATRQRMLSPRMSSAAKRYPRLLWHYAGMTFVIRDNVVVTVHPRKKRRKKRVVPNIANE